MDDFVYLRDVENFKIEREVLHTTRDLLAKPGRDEREALVLWAGSRTSEATFQVTTTLFPPQEATGLDFYVHPSAVRAVFDRLEEERLVLAGQVHTHPGEAFHSLTDDAFPLATQVGSLSVVVPDFAANPLDDLSECAVYRLTEEGWRGPLTGDALNGLIDIAPSETRPGDTE